MEVWLERLVSLLSIKPVIKYKLGADRISGNEPALDCSAFIWRVLGERKYDPEKEVWRNTDWLYNDIEKNNTKFDKVSSLAEVKGGDIIVYGWEKGKVGHVALITSVNSKGHILGWDCSSSAGGISHRNLSFFKKKRYTIGRFK